MSVIGKEKNYILQLANIEDEDAQMVGEFGLKFALMESLNLKVPDTFIITSLAFDDFLTAANLVDVIIDTLGKVRVGEFATAVKASEIIRDLIFTSTFPSLFLNPLTNAYKSLGSGKAIHVKLIPSWVLEEDTNIENQLNQTQNYIYGEEALLVGIKEAWLSLFTPKAIYERAESRYAGPLSIAVVVQKIVQGESSGVVYSSLAKNNENYVKVNARFGLQRGTQDTNEVDTFLIDKNDLKITEKNIREQKDMILLKGRPTGKDTQSSITIPISEHWQNSQKLDDKTIIELASIAKHIETEFTNPVRFNFIHQGNINFILDLEDYEKASFDDVNNNSEEIIDRSKLIAKEEEDEKEIKTKDIDYNSLVDEVEQAVADDEEIILSPKTEIIPNTDNEFLAEIKHINQVRLPDNNTQAITIESIDNFKLPQTFSKFTLNISGFSSETLLFAKYFSGVNLDIKTIFRKEHFMPEDLLADQDKINQSIQLLVNEIATAGKIAEENPIIINISNFSSDDYHYLAKPIGATGAERFIEVPATLAFEYIAIKKAKRDYGLGPLYIALPDIRNYTHLTELKNTLSQNGFRRGTTQKLGISVNLPATELVLEDIEPLDIDFAVINIGELANLLIGSKKITEHDKDVIERKVTSLLDKLKKLKVETVVSLNDYWEFLEPILELKPDYLILDSIPSEQILKTIETFELSDMELNMPKKRGRKPKEI